MILPSLKSNLKIETNKNFDFVTSLILNYQQLFGEMMRGILEIYSISLISYMTYNQILVTMGTKTLSFYFCVLCMISNLSKSNSSLTWCFNLSTKCSSYWVWTVF